MTQGWQVFLLAITAAVAVYGAGLSTYSQIRRSREKKIRVKVSLSFGFRPVGADIGPQMLILAAMNHGEKPVMLTSCALWLPGNRRMVSIPQRSFDMVSLPHELKPGRSCQQFFTMREIAEALHENRWTGIVKLRAEYGDALGNHYRSKPVKANVEDWLKQ